MQPPLDLAGEKVAVNICYEDVFGEELLKPGYERVERIAVVALTVTLRC